MSESETSGSERTCMGCHGTGMADSWLDEFGNPKVGSKDGKECPYCDGTGSLKLVENLSEQADLAGYPHARLHDLTERSQRLFIRNARKWGTGENWLPPDNVSPENTARWHIWKACDELFQTRDAVYPDEMDYDEALRTGGDALNHLLFALDIAARDDNSTTDS